MKKKKGFTLIELLAVIVILAIIALIATPTILGVIEKAKKGSFKNSVYGLIDSANLYVAEHLESSTLTFTCDGKSCSSKDGGKLSFKGSVPKSGNIIVDSKQKVSVEIITDGIYCATGTLENLAVEKGCNNLDTTAPTIDENGVVLTSTTNSITVKIAENFAKDPESGIKEYKVTVNGETKILKEVGSLTFTGLTKETEYSVEINVFNNKNLNNKLIKKIVTKNFDNPSITLTNTPTTAVNGYLKSQVAKITYNGTNISSPKYFVKTTREGTSSLAVTATCGTGTTPSTCTNVTSTKTLTANTWYQVSGNVNVTYNKAASATGTVYAITYDGTNYSGASTATLSKIDTTSPTFTVNSSTGGVGSSGTISIENVNEQESGIEGYYIGQVKPNSIGDNVTFEKSTSFPINASGTWYVAIKDNAGNVSEVQNLVYYSLTLNSDGATNYSTNSAFIKAGTVITLPTGLTKTGYKANTWTDGISSITIDKNISLTPNWEESFKGIMLENGIYNEENFGTLSGATFSNGKIIYNSYATNMNHSKSVHLDGTYKSLIMIGSGSYGVGAYRAGQWYFRLRNADTGEVVREVSMGGHNNGYHDPYGIEWFNFSNSYSLDVSGLEGNFKVSIESYYTWSETQISYTATTIKFQK